MGLALSIVVAIVTLVICGLIFFASFMSDAPGIKDGSVLWLVLLIGLGISAVIAYTLNP